MIRSRKIDCRAKSRTSVRRMWPLAQVSRRIRPIESEAPDFLCADCCRRLYQGRPSFPGLRIYAFAVCYRQIEVIEFLLRPSAAESGEVSSFSSCLLRQDAATKNLHDGVVDAGFGCFRQKLQLFGYFVWNVSDCHCPHGLLSPFDCVMKSLDAIIISYPTAKGNGVERRKIPDREKTKLALFDVPRVISTVRRCLCPMENLKGTIHEQQKNDSWISAIRHGTAGGDGVLVLLALPAEGLCRTRADVAAVGMEWHRPCGVCRSVGGRLEKASQGRALADGGVDRRICHGAVFARGSRCASMALPWTRSYKRRHAFYARVCPVCGMASRKEVDSSLDGMDGRRNGRDCRALDVCQKRRMAGAACGVLQSRQLDA